MKHADNQSNDHACKSWNPHGSSGNFEDCIQVEGQTEKKRGLHLQNKGKLGNTYQGFDILLMAP